MGWLQFAPLLAAQTTAAGGSILELALREGPGFVAGLLVGLVTAWRYSRKELADRDTAHAEELGRFVDRMENEIMHLRGSEDRLVASLLRDREEGSEGDTK